MTTPDATDLQSRVNRTSTMSKAVHAPPPPLVHPNTVPSSLAKRLPNLKRAPGIGWRRAIRRCAPKDLELTKNVPYGSVALRITDKDLILEAVLDIIQIAKKNYVKVIVWVAAPCASACPWKHTNAARGSATGDKGLSNRLIKHADKVCRLAQLLGGDYVWEWPEKCGLRKNWRVRALTSGQGCFVNVSASAVGWEAYKMGKVAKTKR